MNNVLILLDNLDDWKPYYETSSVLTVSDYLKNKPVEKDRKLVINLSDDYSYNSEGYYCSLLAQTRGQKVIPDVDIINKLETGTGVRMDRSLQALCYQWIQKNNVKDDIWYLNIYFGKCREKGLERIARFIFENYLYRGLPVFRDLFLLLPLQASVKFLLSETHVSKESHQS